MDHHPLQHKFLAWKVVLVSRNVFKQAFQPTLIRKFQMGYRRRDMVESCPSTWAESPGKEVDIEIHDSPFSFRQVLFKFDKQRMGEPFWKLRLSLVSGSLSGIYSLFLSQVTDDHPSRLGKTLGYTTREMRRSGTDRDRWDWISKNRNLRYLSRKGIYSATKL